jgi:hypothetical protein
MNKGDLLARLPIAFLIKWCVILAALAAVFVLVKAILDPFFVYYQIPHGIEILAVACFIAIPWAAWKVLTNPTIKRSLKPVVGAEQDAAAVIEQSNKKYWIALGCAVAGVYGIVFESNQFDEANQLAHYRNIAIIEMQNDCAESCALYGVTKSSLVGPHLEHVGTSEPHSGQRDYVFSWYAIRPKVKLTEHVYNYDGQKWFDPEVIDAQWMGAQLPPAPVLAEVVDDLVPHYTALRPDFHKVIRSAMPEIKNAYMRAKLADPDLSGDVKVHIIVDTYGQVAAASIVDSDLNDADFESNLVYIIKGLTFKSGQFATLDLVYTFSF